MKTRGVRPKIRHVTSAQALRPLLRASSGTAALALALLAAGCVRGLHASQPAEQLYVLRPPMAAGASSVAASAPSASSAAVPVPFAPAPALGATLQVLLPLASAGLAGDGIAVIRPGQRLDYYRDARWAGDVPSMLQALVVQALRAGGRFALVEPDSGPFQARYQLSLELTHFEADYGTGGGPPTVRVTLTGTLGRRATRSAAASVTAQAAAGADADRMQAVIAAFERATGEALSQLAAGLTPPP